MTRKSKRQIAVGVVCVVIGVALIVAYSLFPITTQVISGTIELPGALNTGGTVFADETSLAADAHGRVYLPFVYNYPASGYKVGIFDGAEWALYQPLNPAIASVGPAPILTMNNNVILAIGGATDTEIYVGGRTDGGWGAYLTHLNKIQISRSSDGGNTWSSPITLSEGQGGGGEIIFMWLLNKGQEIYLFVAGYGYTQTGTTYSGRPLFSPNNYRIWRWTSSDGGLSWSGPTYKLNLQGLTLASGLTLTSGDVLEMYFDGTKIHLLIQAYSGVFEATYVILYGHSSDFGQTFTVTEIPQSTIGFNARNIGSSGTFLISYGNKIVVTALDHASYFEQKPDSLHWYESSWPGTSWTHYQYSITSHDWLSLGAPLAVYGNTVYAWWFKDNPQTGKPSLIRWDGVGEPSTVVEFTSPTSKNLTAVGAITAGDKVYVSAGVGYTSSPATFDDLLVATFPYGAEGGQALTTTPPSWLLYLGVVLTVIGLLLVTTSWRGKEKKKKSARA